MSQNSVALVPSQSMPPGMRSSGSEIHRGRGRKNGGLMMRMVGCFVPQSRGQFTDSETVNRNDPVLFKGSAADCGVVGVTSMGHTTTTVHGNGNMERMKKNRVLSYSNRKKMSKKERLAEEARRLAEEEEARRDAEALALYLGKKSNHAAVKNNVVAEISNTTLSSDEYQGAAAQGDRTDSNTDGMVMKTPDRAVPLQNLKNMMEKDVEGESDETKDSHQSNMSINEADGVITFDEYGGVRKSMSMMSRNVSELELPAVGQEQGFMPRNGSMINVLATPQRSEIMKSGRYNEDGTSDGSDGAYNDGADHDGNITPTSSEDQSTVQRIFNKRILEPLPDSCFLDLAEHYEGEIAGRQIKASVIQGGAMRRNVSWTGEISVSMFPRSKSAQYVNRRHTVLVLMNQDSDEEEENDDVAKEISLAGNIGDDNVKRSHSVQRKLSQVYDTHHVHLKKLREQMGDSNTPPKDLLALMARKVFVSQAMLDDDDDLLDGINNCSDHSYTETSTSHDLEDCSSRLPRIKTRRQPAPSCHL